MGLRNISAKKITVPSRTIVFQVQLANMVPPIQTPKEQTLSENTENKKEDESCILDQLDLGEICTWSVEQQQAARKLLCDYSETFSKMIWTWENVIFQNITFNYQINSHSKKDTRGFHLIFLKK